MYYMPPAMINRVNMSHLFLVTRATVMINGDWQVLGIVDCFSKRPQTSQLSSSVVVLTSAPPPFFAFLSMWLHWEWWNCCPHIRDTQKAMLFELIFLLPLPAVVTSIFLPLFFPMLTLDIHSSPDSFLAVCFPWSLWVKTRKWKPFRVNQTTHWHM